MNKIFKYITVAAAVLTVTASCNKEEDLLFDQSTAKRLNAATENYAKRLADSKGGWIMEYYATNDAAEYNSGEAASYMGFPIVTQFNADGSVLVAMNNAFSGDHNFSEDSRSFSGSGYKEEKSLWQIIGDNGPVLTFNTYNELFHTFSDPRSYSVEDLGWGNSSSNIQGQGLLGDYEFIMIDVPEGGQHIMLKGKKRGTYIRLTRLPEGTDFDAYLTDLKNFQKLVFPQTAPNYCVLTVDGDKFKTNEMFSTIPNLYTYDGDELADESYHPFLITKRNDKYYLRFRDKFSYTYTATDETKNYDIQELVYDADKNYFYQESKPENTLKPQDATDFFLQQAYAEGWTFARNNGTGALNDAYNAVYNDFKAIKYTLQNMALIEYPTDNINYTALRVRYSTGKSTANALYLFTAENVEGGVKMTYKEPANTASQTIHTKLTSIQTMIDALSGTFKISPKTTPFNLSSIVLTNAADESSSYTITSVK